MKEIKTKDLVYMAFYVALFMVLDTFVNTMSLFRMPNGGSLGVSTIALLTASYHLGWQKGLVVSLISVFAQFVTGPMYTPDLLGFILDYLLAFSVYGLASIFPNYKSLYIGVFATNLIRFVLHTISGVYIWGLTWIPSAEYQITYMLPTLIAGLVFVPIVMKALGPILKRRQS